MYFHLVHSRAWRRVLPHFDVRECPMCGANVFRKAGQKSHLAWHTWLQEELQGVPKRLTDAILAAIDGAKIEPDTDRPEVPHDESEYLDEDYNETEKERIPAL